jgi:SAM-dependent methyltransferase
MFHPFLERELSLGIIGVDRIDGLCPHPQRMPIMDYCVDFRTYTGFPDNFADVVYWLSAIEHNSIEEQKDCIKASMRVLKPGGLFLSTFTISPKTHYFEPSQCTNLSIDDAEMVYSTQWKERPVYEKIVAEYQLDLMELDTRHTKRYNTTDYAFIVAGAELIKP